MRAMTPDPGPEGTRKGMPNRRQVIVLCRESAPPQGDRKGPHSAPRHSRPYKTLLAKETRMTGIVEERKDGKIGSLGSSVRPG